MEQNTAGAANVRWAALVLPTGSANRVGIAALQRGEVPTCDSEPAEADGSSDREVRSALPVHLHLSVSQAQLLPVTLVVGA